MIISILINFAPTAIGLLVGIGLRRARRGVRVVSEWGVVQCPQCGRCRRRLDHFTSPMIPTTNGSVAQESPGHD
jgi:D-arabinose 1-dehydrogenase-like Zn-dependent alcohol dehydrogenase